MVRLKIEHIDDTEEKLKGFFLSVFVLTEHTDDLSRLQMTISELVGNIYNKFKGD